MTSGGHVRASFRTPHPRGVHALTNLPLTLISSECEEGSPESFPYCGRQSLVSLSRQAHYYGVRLGIQLFEQRGV